MRYLLFQDADGWGVNDSALERDVLRGETHVIAEQLCDSLNGRFEAAGEVEEMADQIRGTAPESPDLVNGGQGRMPRSVVADAMWGAILIGLFVLIVAMNIMAN